MPTVGCIHQLPLISNGHMPNPGNAINVIEIIQCRHGKRNHLHNKTCNFEGAKFYLITLLANEIKRQLSVGALSRCKIV